MRGGIPYAIAKSLAAAPFADLLWMETKTADLDDAREFAEAIHAEFPDKMLAYNLSPSFSWDTTGMSDEQMRRFPEELGKLGFVFNFITYGGHQIDGLAAEEFATALQQDGMLALARLQRKLRMVESPYRTPADPGRRPARGRRAGRYVGAHGDDHGDGQGLDPAPAPGADRGAEEAARGVAGDVDAALRAPRRAPRPAAAPPRRLGAARARQSTARARRSSPTSIFAPIHDRRGRSILSVRDQNTFAESLRKKRLMTLVHLFLVHRYKADSVHYVTPTDDNQYQAAKMKSHGIFREVNTEVGQIIVADVDHERISELLAPDHEALRKLICKER